MLVPVIGLVQVTNQAMADRFTYLPQIGIGIALVWGLCDQPWGWLRNRWLCGLGSALALTVLMGVFVASSIVLARQCSRMDSHAELHVAELHGPQLAGHCAGFAGSAR